MTQVLFGRQFVQQEVLRTITLGLSPFIPFSQQYVMAMKQEQDNTTMMPNPPMGSRAADPKWEARKQAYFSQPRSSPREILNKGPEVDTREIAKRLQFLFEKDVGTNPTARKYEESVVGEILSSVGAEKVDKILNELGTPIQKGIDGSPLFTGARPVGGQGFDRVMTDQLRTVFSEAFGGRDMSKVVAIEETEAQYAKELQEGLRGLDDTKAAEQFTNNVVKVYGNMNKLLKNIKADNEDELLGGLIMAREDPFYATDAYTKQVLARAIDMFSRGLGNAQYMYTVPLGNTGMAGTVFIKHVMKNKSPQISYQMEVTKTGGRGRLIELMATGLTNINIQAGTAFTKQIAAMDQIAINQAILTADRVGYIGKMQEVTLSQMLDIGADISLSTQKAPGVMGLSSKDMADNLQKQMTESLKDPKVKNSFTKIYLELIAKANDASQAWKHAVSPPPEFTSNNAGVWKESGPNWKEQEGSDFSVSPFLIMRRKGVASFKPENKASFL